MVSLGDGGFEIRGVTESLLRGWAIESRLLNSIGGIEEGGTGESGDGDDIESP